MRDEEIQALLDARRAQRRDWFDDLLDALRFLFQLRRPKRPISFEVAVWASVLGVVAGVAWSAGLILAEQWGLFAGPKVLYPALLGAGVGFFWAKALAAWSQQAKLHEQFDTQRLCESCGYPLEGLKSPRCPECGSTL